MKRLALFLLAVRLSAGVIPFQVFAPGVEPGAPNLVIAPHSIFPVDPSGLILCRWWEPWPDLDVIETAAPPAGNADFRSLYLDACQDGKIGCAPAWIPLEVTAPVPEPGYFGCFLLALGVGLLIGRINRSLRRLPKMEDRHGED